MKKPFAALMCMAAVAMFTACIGNTNKKNADGATETKTEAKAKTEKMTAENWKEIIKDNYDFDFALPEDWNFQKGMKTNINPAYWLVFTDGTEQPDYQAFVQKMFDMTANIIPGTGNFNDNKEPITKPNYIWMFNTPKGSVQFAISENSSDNSVSINLCFVGDAIK